MRKIAILILFAFVFSSLLSCRAEPDAYAMLNSFVRTYGAEGIIYSPEIAEGNAGYVYEGLMEKIYRFSGDFPTNYAVFLNNRVDHPSECGLFVCSDAEMLDMVEEMCLERIRLLSLGEDHAFVKRSRNICFYSTMQDRDRAERIFSQIIR